LHTFDYPYPKAVSSAEDQGMEYPMICWNYGPDENGVLSERIKNGMIGG
jgi:hypothetical protein